MNVYEGLASVMVAVGHIGKVGSKDVSYKFRSVDDVMNALHGPLAYAGLFLSPRVLDDWQLNPIPGTPNSKGEPRTQFQASFRICVDVYASDGSTVTLGPGLAQSHDYGDKAVYQAQQNAVKYILLEALAIPTEEQDMDARTPDDVPADPNWKRWVWEESAIFKRWTDEERKTNAVLAMERVLNGADLIANQVEAQAVLTEMRSVYEAETPGKLPLEGEDK